MTEIQCVVEDIVFKNEENGYVVAHVKEKNDKNNNSWMHTLYY